jgi:hypothetical protein
MSEQQRFVVTVALKVEVSGDNREDACAKAIAFLNEQMEDRQPWEDHCPSWQTMSVRPQQDTDPVNCDGDERVWLDGDYAVDDLGGFLDYTGVPRNA